jgi:hypothetical protein
LYNLYSRRENKIKKNIKERKLCYLYESRLKIGSNDHPELVILILRLKGLLALSDATGWELDDEKRG